MVDNMKMQKYYLKMLLQNYKSVYFNTAWCQCRAPTSTIRLKRQITSHEQNLLSSQQHALVTVSRTYVTRDSPHTEYHHYIFHCLDSLCVKINLSGLYQGRLIVIDDKKNSPPPTSQCIYLKIIDRGANFQALLALRL